MLKYSVIEIFKKNILQLKKTCLTLFTAEYKKNVLLWH